MDEILKEELWKEYQKSKSPGIREQLIIEYSSLVNVVAGRMSMHLGHLVEYDDLVGYGIFGLIDAIDKFELTKGVKFETYASLRIRGAILDQIRKMDWIPRTLRQKQKKLDAASKELELELGRQPKEEELAQKLQISMKELNDLINETQVANLVSLDEYLEQGSEVRAELGNRPRFEQPDQVVARQELKRTLSEAIDSLTENERKVIALYYYEELTLKEISMILEVSESRVSQLHTKALKKMREKLENNEQVILFLNRRGFSSYQLCSSCGEVIKCPNCDITLTYHKTSGMNRCHYCGYAEKKKDICPKCKNESLKDFGQGTEKVEEEIKKIFQSYRTVRMDIDTTTKKGAHEKIINSFLNHEYDILVGTQMIAKGLDFPLVSLVGVINADTILNFPDFRSSERTYQMLSQVSGRAGRGNIKGDVIIQTFNPDNYSIELSKTHNYVDFFNKEIKIRKDLKYPPYYFISLIKIGSKDYNLSLSESKKIANYIRENISEDMIVLGPSVSGVSRVNKIYYFQIIIKFRNKEKMREILNNVSDLENNNKVSISIDINPC